MARTDAGRCSGRHARDSGLHHPSLANKSLKSPTGYQHSGRQGLVDAPLRGRVTPELAQDLIAFVRTFGPAGSTAPTAANTEFAARFKELQKQFDELDLQVQSLSRP